MLVNCFVLRTKFLSRASGWFYCQNCGSKDQLPPPTKIRTSCSDHITPVSVSAHCCACCNCMRSVLMPGAGKATDWFDREIIHHLILFICWLANNFAAWKRNIPRPIGSCPMLKGYPTYVVFSLHSLSDSFRLDQCTHSVLIPPADWRRIYHVTSALIIDYWSR